ncbi:MAG: beta-lactamase family protein [Anaerolineales bacterium]|nr:beta-lactamase family protein [Anaerolineales bacterium]
MATILGHFEPILRKVPGVVVAALAEDRLDVTALGTLDSEGDPASLCWEIGSITKVFTGLLLAEMSIRGEVGLDEPIGRHLPDSVARRLPILDLQPTLTHLATHTAGLPRLPLAIYLRARGSDDPYAKLNEDDVFACLGPKTKLPRRPRMRYSNFGMGLLGHLLARVAGRPYGALIRERVLAPLGMTSTAAGDCGDGMAMVQGFRRGRPTPPWSFGALEGAGALRSTVTDLATFARACIQPPDGTIGEALRLAQQPFHVGRLPFAQMGLGWMLRDANDDPTLWHDGGTYGSSSFLAINVRRSIAVISLGNAGPRMTPPLDRPSWALLDSLKG